MDRWTQSFCALLCSMTMVTGCSNRGPVADIVDTVKVSGTLTFKGKPLPGYQVNFQSASGERSATGISDSEGRFVLGTNDLGDGAPAGIHKVFVAWVAPSDDGMGLVIDDPAKMPKPPVDIPAKYSNPETSGITLTVPPGGTTDLSIELE